MVDQVFTAYLVKSNKAKIFMKKFSHQLLLSAVLLTAACHTAENSKTPEMQVLEEQITPPKKPQTKQQYVAGSDDIPLFLGLKQVDDDNANFDSTSGSITISSYASEDVSVEKVKNFYLGTLPQLGWKLNRTKKDPNKLSYVRTDETLEISFEQQDNKLLVKFFISSSL